MILLLLSLAVAAPDAANTTGTDRDPTVCKAITRTGSRLRAQRVCKPASEWNIMSTRARNELSDLQRKSQPENTVSF